MSDFRTNVRDAVNAMVKIGYNKSDALDLLWRDNPKLFSNYFTSEEDVSNGGYYYINTYIARMTLSNRILKKLTTPSDNHYGGMSIPVSDYNFFVKDKKINAIKYVRAITHWGLKEAKDFIEGTTMYLTPAQATDLRDMFAEGMYADDIKNQI